MRTAIVLLLFCVVGCGSEPEPTADPLTREEREALADLVDARRMADQHERGEASEILAAADLQRETAAEILAVADEAYRSGAYVQAIDKYERYLDKFPDEPNVSMARVRIGMAQLWQLVDSRDKRPALEAANEILPRIEPEPAFADARPELASILSEIAQGFATQAKEEEDIEKAQELLNLATRAMELADNPIYIPTSLRKTIETKLNRIREDMQLGERNINRTKRLAEAVKQIRAAADAGKTAEAYRIRDTLLRGEKNEAGDWVKDPYPELEVHRDLLEIMSQLGEANPKEPPP